MSPITRKLFYGIVAPLNALALSPAAVHATWSVIAADRATGQVVIASATCVSQAALERFPAKGLMDVQAIVVPGVGVAAAQAGVDRTRANQMLIYQQMKAGTHPSAILQQLMADTSIQSRQFGIVDVQGRFAGFSGARNRAASLDVQGQVPETEIFYSIQGNILRSNAVVQNAVRAFEDARGTLADRVMAAMEAADAAGGDGRCVCTTQPLPDAPCTGRTAHVAYLLVADRTDPEGTSHNDGRYALFLDVHDQNIRADENANPVITLRRRYDAWKRERGPGGNGSRPRGWHRARSR